jgi:LysR family glycine cleavage system transcriptional activator
MPRPDDLPLNALRAFSVAVRFDTFTAAANHMGVSQVAISRQISLLERHIGVKLFERGPRSVTLTASGRAFGHEIADLFHELEDVTDRLLSREREHTVTLRVYPTFAHHWLLPRMASFRAKHPEDRIRMETKIERLDFRGTHLDLAVHLGHGSWQGARSRKLFDDTADLVCSPEYAARHDGFRSSSSLSKALLLKSRYRSAVWADWAAHSGLALDRAREVTYDSSVLAYSAALQGHGLAMGQMTLLAEDLAAGRLVRPFSQTIHTGMAYFVVWPSDRSVLTKTRHLVDWMLTETGNDTQFFRKPTRKRSS